MVQYKANGPQRYKKILKEATIEAKKSRILKAKKLTIKGVKAKLRILAEEDI